MSLPHILLGLLAKPASGYDLHREFENSLAHFWSANLSQIYPALKAMEKEGLVTSAAVAPALGPARRLYARTDVGQQALAAWLTDGPQILNVRRHYLAQVYLLNNLGSDEAARDFFAKLLHTLVSRQAALEAIEAGWRGDRGADFSDRLESDEFYPYMALELGIAANSTRIGWCRRCLTRIDQRCQSER